MADFADDGTRTYMRIVYGKGGAALHAARDAVGAEAFDAAVRCYVDANAWTIATPEDVGAVLAGLPDAVAVLTGAGMLDEDDVPADGRRYSAEPSSRCSRPTPSARSSSPSA